MKINALSKALLTGTLLCASLLLSSCLSMLTEEENFMSGATKGEAYRQFYEEKPVVLLIMPPINNSANVDAKDYFYTTLSVPLAEAGYYVLPPNLMLEVLQRESAYDAEMFIDGDLSQFHEIFGADAAVFTTITAWTKSLLDSSVTVKIEYLIKSTRTNEVLYTKSGIVITDASQNLSSGESLVGSLADIFLSALSTMLTDYMDMAVICNNRVLSDLPAGKYSPNYGSDASRRPTNSTITINLKN